MPQQERDCTAGLDTAGFASGYRGSSLGALDRALWKVKRHLAGYNIVFRAGLNENPVATAVWDSQQVNLCPSAKFSGVFDMWYGKGPGVSRMIDVFKHVSSAGSPACGGVLVPAGDDHTAKSSTLVHQSEHVSKAAGISMLYSSNVQEYLDYGLHGWATSRYFGLRVSTRYVADVVESSVLADVNPHRA